MASYQNLENQAQSFAALRESMVLTSQHGLPAVRAEAVSGHSVPARAPLDQ